MPEERLCGCACGKIRLRVAGSLRSVANCHCTKCRKLYGTAFSTLVIIRQGDLTIESGAESVSVYQVSPEFSRHFCGHCGAPLYSRSEQLPGFYLLPIGVFDRPDDIRAMINVHCRNMLDWVPELMSLKSFDDEYQR